MKLRYKMLIVTTAAATLWISSERSAVDDRMAHEFLTSPAQTASNHQRVEPVQLAVLMQSLR